MVYSLRGDPLDASLFADEQEAIKRAKHFQEAIVYAVAVKPYAKVYMTGNTEKK
jgi:hypothetical protein